MSYFDQLKSFWWDKDDFLGDSIDDRWTQTLVGGGTISVVDQVEGGVCRLSTPTADDVATLDWGDYRSLHIDHGVKIEARIRINGGVTDTQRRLLYLWYDSNNRFGFYQSYDDETLKFYTVDDGSALDGSTSVELDDDWHIYKIEIDEDGYIVFKFDDVECDISPRTTNIPNDAGDWLQPHIDIDSNSDTDPATSMDIDYISWGQWIE